jgi:hypothetical protein
MDGKVFYHKLKELIYPVGTPILHEGNSIYLGTAKLKDVPNCIDEFYRLRFVWFSKWTKRFWVLRGFVERLFKGVRFVSFSEFLEVYRDRATVRNFDELMKYYPIYKLLGITDVDTRNRFINSYPDTLEGYFELMKRKNEKLWSFFNRSYPVRLPDGKGKHRYVVGGTGSGKSELLKHLLIEDINRKDKCVILIEPNGDLSEQVARQASLDKGRLVYVDCSLSPRTPRINPFELINLENELDIEKQSQVIRNALVQIFAMDGQPLTLQMQSILQPCLEIVAKQRGNLLDLQRFMVDGVNADLVEAGQQSQKHGDFFNYKFKETNLVVSRQGIYQKLLNLLNFSVFSDFFCGNSTIDIRRAIDENKVMLFNLSKGKLGDYSSCYIGMMMVAIIQNLIFHRANIRSEMRTPVRIYIDEFQDFVTESSEQIFVQGRKYNVGLTVASQIVGQKMTTEMTRIVL